MDPPHFYSALASYVRLRAVRTTTEAVCVRMLLMRRSLLLVLKCGTESGTRATPLRDIICSRGPMRRIVQFTSIDIVRPLTLKIVVPCSNEEAPYTASAMLRDKRVWRTHRLGGKKHIASFVFERVTGRRIVSFELATMAFSWAEVRVTEVNDSGEVSRVLIPWSAQGSLRKGGSSVTPYDYATSRIELSSCSTSRRFKVSVRCTTLPGLRGGHETGLAVCRARGF